MSEHNMRAIASQIYGNTEALAPGIKTIDDLVIGFVHSAIIACGAYKLHHDFASMQASLKLGWNENPNIVLIKYCTSGENGVTVKFARLSNGTIDMNIRFTGPSAPTRSTTLSLRSSATSSTHYTPGQLMEEALPTAEHILKQLSESPLKLPFTYPIRDFSHQATPHPVSSADHDTTAAAALPTSSVTISREATQPPPVVTSKPLPTAESATWKELPSDHPPLARFPPSSPSHLSHVSPAPTFPLPSSMSPPIRVGRTADARAAAGTAGEVGNDGGNDRGSVRGSGSGNGSGSGGGYFDDRSGLLSRHPAPAPPGALGGYGGHELVGPEQLLPHRIPGPGIYGDDDDDDNYYNGGRGYRPYHGGPSGPGFFGPASGNPAAPGIPGFPAMGDFPNGMGGPSGPGFPALPGKGKNQPKFPAPRFDPYGPFSGMGEPDNDHEKKKGRGFGPGGMF